MYYPALLNDMGRSSPPQNTTRAMPRPQRSLRPWRSDSTGDPHPPALNNLVEELVHLEGEGAVRDDEATEDNPTDEGGGLAGLANREVPGLATDVLVRVGVAVATGTLAPGDDLGSATGSEERIHLVDRPH